MDNFLIVERNGSFDCLSGSDNKILLESNHGEGEYVGFWSGNDFCDIFDCTDTNVPLARAFALTGFWLVRVLESISDGVIVVDKNTIVRYVNKAYIEIKGLGRNELIGRRVADVLEPGKYLPEVIRTGRPILNIPLKTGTIEYIVNVYPVRHSGKVTGAVSILKDITLARTLAQKISLLEKAVQQSNPSNYSLENFIGCSTPVKILLAKATKAATADCNILITGESGTGKEILAHALHTASYRNEGPFVAINCSALPAELMESELFGYEPGAFTGAGTKGKLGLIEIADHGTMFLDEIGDMSPILQAKLLRVLQDRKIRRLGSVQEKPVNVRVVAATNRNLELLMKGGQFREDLFYRLNVFPLSIPPLRERKDDIPHLISHFCKRLGSGNATISNEALNVLTAYDWPGNVRELENCIEFAFHMAEENEILIEHIPPKIVKESNVVPAEELSSLNHLLYEKEKSVIVKLLHRYGKTTEGKKKVAEKMGVSLATLYNKLKRHGIV